MSFRSFLLRGAIVAGIAVMASGTALADRLDDIRKAGVLRVGVFDAIAANFTITDERAAAALRRLQGSHGRGRAEVAVARQTMAQSARAGAPML